MYQYHPPKSRVAGARERQKEQINQSAQAFARSNHGVRIQESIKAVRPVGESLLLLNWIPEQDADIYVVLVGIHDIVVAEIPKGDDAEAQIELEWITLPTYRRNLRGSNVRDFALALEVAQAITYSRDSHPGDG